MRAKRERVSIFAGVCGESVKITASLRGDIPFTSVLLQAKALALFLEWLSDRHPNGRRL